MNGQGKAPLDGSTVILGAGKEAEKVLWGRELMGHRDRKRSGWGWANGHQVLA